MTLDILHSRRARRLGLVCAIASLWSVLGAASATATIVRFNTVHGSFDVRLFDTATPLSVANFLSYVTAGDYNNVLLHRSEPGFVIQGGRWRFDGTEQEEPQDYPQIPQRPAVQNEPGISNRSGTIAFAKFDGDPNSATREWFFNIGNNTGLDSPANNGGFTVFGKVLGNGMTVVNKLAAEPNFGFAGAWNHGPMRNYSMEDYHDFVKVGADNVLNMTISVLNVPAGDYVLDGWVTTADYNKWRTTYGSTTDVAADGNGSGKVDLLDYVVWRMSLGQRVPFPSGSSVVPEPATGLLALASCFLVASSRRFLRRRRNTGF